MDITYEITPQAEIHADINTGGNVPYTLPPATSSALGGVKADPKQSGDTQPVRIGTDGKLWTANTGGGEVDRSDELVSVLNTYYTNRSIGFVYSASNTPIKGTYVDGSNNIDCSTFIILGLMGIDFANSPYNHIPLAIGSQDWAFNPVPYAIDTAAELCEMLTYSGCRLKWEKKDNITTQDLRDAGVRNGDILFISNEANGRYMDITHTSIIWDIDATYPILEVTSSANVVQRGSIATRGQNIVAICRPVVNENATARYTAGCEDFVRAHSGGGSATDVQINGTSITQDGVANIPVASTSQLGAVKMGGANNGIGLGSADQLYVVKASDAEITARGNNYKPIVPNNLNYAVTAVLTDGKAPALTDAQKAQAQSWLGIDTILGLVEAVSEVVG